MRWFLPRCAGQAALAEDLTQETLLVAWRIRTRFTSEERGARPWLAAIARNVLLSSQRATSGARIDPLKPAIHTHTLTDADDALDPVWLSGQPELRRALERALETVARGARELLVWRYLREVSIAEIALAERADGCPRGRSQRARSAVRTAIEDLFPADFAHNLADDYDRDTDLAPLFRFGQAHQDGLERRIQLPSALSGLQYGGRRLHDRVVPAQLSRESDDPGCGLRPSSVYVDDGPARALVRKNPFADATAADHYLPSI